MEKDRDSTDQKRSDDLELLLSLHQDTDRVSESPPSSPVLSDDEDGTDKTCRTGTTRVDMSAFRDVVGDCLDYQPQPQPNIHVQNKVAGLTKSTGTTATQPVLDKFSGLMIRNQLVSPAELQDMFSDIRFVRLPVIKNLVVGDSLSGSWATVAVLTDQGPPKTSSSGKSYCVWKIGSLCQDDVSLFLFGDAYQRNSSEKAGTSFALFNCNVRKDNMGGFSLSIFSPSQILKIGTSADYGTCKGKKKDGTACTLAVNRRRAMFCKYHKMKTSDKYTKARAQIGGGNIRMAYRDHLRSEGIYVADPVYDSRTSNKTTKSAKLLSVDGLKRALSKAGGVTTSAHSQGIRFLTQVTDAESKRYERQTSLISQQEAYKKKGKRSTTEACSSSAENQPKKVKEVKEKEFLNSSCKPGLIELEIFSSGDEL